MAKNTDPEFDIPNQRLSNAMEMLEDLRSRTDDIGKSISMDVKGITQAVVDGLTSAKKLYEVTGKATADIGKMTSMIETFSLRSMSAASALEEIQRAAAHGFNIDDKLKKINTEIARFSNFQNIISKDTQLRRDLTATLTSDTQKQTKSLLEAKTALASIDATMLHDEEIMGFRGASLDFLKKEVGVTTELVDQGEFRMRLVNEFIEKNKEQLEIQNKFSELQTKIQKAEAASSKRKFGPTENDISKLDELRANLVGVQMLLGDSQIEIDEIQEAWAREVPSRGALDMSKVQSQLGKFQNEIATMTNRRMKAQIALTEQQIEFNDAEVVGNKLRGGYINHLKDQNAAGKKILGNLNEQIVSVQNFISSAKGIPTPFFILDKLLELGYNRFEALDKAAEEFRKQTGYSNTQMVELRKNAESINLEFQHMGIGIEQVYKSAKALTDVFGRTSLVSKDALQNVSLMSANLGVAEEHSAAVLATFQGLGGASEQAAMNVIKVSAGISDKAGIPFKLVMQDVASASEDTLSMLGANPSKLMKSAIAARSMGLELNKLVSSQRKILDFSNSITDEMEASALLGKNVNFQLARQLAFEGRVEDSARATLETVKNAGDFNKMNVYQREALAKAAGMELKDLTKMMAVEAQRDAILKGNDESKKATLKAQEKELAALKKINDLDSADLVKQNEKALMQQKIQGLITKLKNSLESMVVAIGNILEPIITPLVTIVVPVFSLIAWTVGLIAKGLAWILSPIKWIADGVASIADGTGSWSKTVGFVKEQFKDLGTTVGTLIQIAGAGLIAAIFFGSGGVGAVMGMIAKPFKAVGSFAKSLVEKVKGPSVSTGTPDISKGMEKTEKSSSSMKSNNGSGIKSFLTNLAAGLKKMAGIEVLKGALNLIPASIGLVVMIPGVIGAKLLSMVDGEKLSTALEGMAKGFKKMSGVDVLLGALNLIPASIGLVLMIPGVVGAKLLSMIDGDAVKEALGGIASGLKKMASPDVLLGAGSLILASAAFAIMTVGAIGLAAVAFLGKAAGAGLAGLSVGLAALGANPAAWLGILAVGALVAVGVVALAALVGAFALFSSSLKEFTNLKWEDLAKAGVAIVGFGLSVAGLGLIAPFIASGAMALAVLGVALAVFGAGVTVLVSMMPALTEGIEKMIAPLNTLGGIAGGLFVAAGGIAAIGVALAAFGAGSAVAGIGNFIGGFLGGDPIDKLKELSSMGSQLQLTADSIQKISNSMSNFGAVDAFALSVDKLTLSLSKLNSQVENMSVIKLAALSVISAAAPTAAPATEAAAADNGSGAIGGKLDELISLMRSGGIAVNLDGRKVSSAMASSGRD